MTERFAVEVAPEVLERHPGYTAVVLVARGIGNGPTDAASDALLTAAEAHLRQRGLARAADHPHVAAWRAAFSAFGAKPSRFPSSAEALAARVLKGRPLPRINQLVDVYNAVSVRHLIPVGGEDADRLRGPLRLVVAGGDERFEPRGGGPPDPPRPAEIVWRDDHGVTCRRWNWRQGERTALTEESRNAFFVFDRLEAMAPAQLEAAVAGLEQELRRRWPDAGLERIVRGCGAEAAFGGDAPGGA